MPASPDRTRPHPWLPDYGRYLSVVDGPLDGPMEVTLDACRCAHLNVVSGPVAREQLHTHLQPAGVDGMGRRIHRCPTAGIEWIEERQHVGYGEDVAVLRRRSR